MKYVFIFYNSLKKDFVYQFNVVVGFLLMIIISVSSQFFWQALVNAGKIPPEELKKYVSYSVMASILGSIFTSELIITMSEKIKHGIIASDLQKPIEIQTLSMAESLGSMVSNFSINFLPQILLMRLLMKIIIPGSFYQMIIFLLSSLLGYILLLSMDYIISLLAFVFVEVWAFQAMKNVLIGFCSGLFMPLWIYPQNILNVMDKLPFKYFFFVPLNIYLGEIQGRALQTALLEQVGWMIALIITGRLLTKCAVKKITLAGG